MAYKFDSKKYEDIYDSMFGEGASEKHLSEAREKGVRAGTAKRKAREEEEARRILEAAAKEAAKMARKKATTKEQTDLAKQNADKKFRIEQAGGDASKKQSALGKFLNLDPNNNVLFDALDIISRPLNAQQEMNKGKVKNLKEMAKDKDTTKKDVISKGISEVLGLINPLLRFDPVIDHKESAKMALDGVSGRKKTFGSDVLDELGMKKGLGRTVAGIGLDVAVDPLNFAGGTIAKGIGAGAKLVGKGASMLPGADKVAKGVDSIFGKGKLKQTRTGEQTDDLINLQRQTENERLYMMNKSQEDVAKAMSQAGGMDKGIVVGREMEAPLLNPQSQLATVPNVLNTQNALASMNAIRNTGNSVQNIITSTIREPIETAARQLQTNPTIKQATQTLVQSNADIRAYAAANGLKITDLEGYMSHFITQEARKALDNAGKKVSDGVAPVGGNKAVTQRTMHDTVENVNKQLKQTTGIDEVFTPNAFIATAGGQHRFINYIARESIKNKVITDPRFARLLDDGVKADKGFVERTIDGKRYELTKGADDVIKNFEKHVTDEGVDAILKGFDKLQNAWKKTALFSLGYHARNAIGNTWNMYASGMRADEVIRFQTEALHYLDKMQASRVGTGAATKLDSTYDEFLQQGLKNTGSTADFAKDVERALMNEVTGKLSSPLGRVGKEIGNAARVQGSAWEKTKAMANAPFAASMQLGNTADEVSRFAMFKWARDKGMTPKEAAEKVREVLFDYTDLTKAERTVFKRAMPFYTWMRKNAEFQLKAFAKNPDRFNRLNIVKENAWDNTDMDREIIPEYLDNNLAMPIPGTDRLANVNLPAADLVKMANPMKMGMDSLTPLLKMPFELFMNKSALDGRTIQEFEGQNGNLLGMEFEKIIPFLPGSGKQQEYAIENLLAPVRNVSGAIERQNDGENPLDIFAKLMGADLAKKYNEEGFRNQYDWNEKERLEGIIKRMEKQDGVDVQTIKELEGQGQYRPEDHRAAASASLKEMGFNDRQVDMLISMKQKVYNSNAEYANEVANLLNDMGLPPEVIEIVTSDYLDY